MPQLKVQNQYNTTITEASGIPASGDATFTVGTPPVNTNGFIVISPDISSQREIMYYHNVIGNTIYVRGDNRILPKPHSQNEVVKMNDVAEIFNFFSDMIGQAFYVEKTGGLNVNVWGGYVYYNGLPQTVADTPLVLANNTTNYIKYAYNTNSFSVDTINTGNIKAQVVTLGGVITSIGYRTAKESYIDFTALDFYKYSIVTSVASGNLTVALKNYEGNDPTPTKPVKIQIGGVIRTITSGTNLSPSGDGSSQIKSGTNWFNLGSAELATKDTDLFLYLVYDTTLSTIGTLVSRIPYGTTIADFSITGTNEKARVTSPNINPISTDPVVNIGRFNAILSAGAGYTWSIPATSVVINSPIYETRWLDWQPSVTASGSMTIASLSLDETKYKISGDSLSINYSATYTTGGTASSDVNSTVPFTFLSSSIIGFSSPCYDSTDFQASGIYQGNGITIRKNGAAWTLGPGRVFGIHTFGRI